MYYPYLRGRQNELLCLKELLAQGKLGDKIIPVIEPVRFNSTFFTTLSKFIDLGRDIIVIHNPKVGKFGKEYEELKKKIEEEADEKKREKLQSNLDLFMSILRDEHVLTAYLSNGNVVSQCLEGAKNVHELILINSDMGNYKYYNEYGDKLEAKITFIPKDEDFKDEVSGHSVVLEDGFVKAKRNADYMDSPDEYFSRNHIVFQKRGYHGFSDYSIVGDNYEDSGFAPSAIAIHIMYFGKKDELWVHHFLSKTNEKTLDPARKFGEAMHSLLEWENYEIIPQTYGLNCLIRFYENGKYPGLGVVKKCSLMHHLEMIGKYLEDK